MKLKEVLLVIRPVEPLTGNYPYPELKKVDQGQKN
jgi:hypothetical protein